jgi:glucose/mannose-6-phosphate isomerase
MDITEQGGSVLDDLKFIHQRDGGDALGIAEKQWQQLTQDFDVKVGYDSIQNVVLAGMGGSALAATFIQSWPGLGVPFEIVRNYTIPAYVNENTLFIASSYSGNTEETLAALKEAQTRNAKVIVISAGGTLSKIAQENDYPYFALPQNFQPRMAVFYNFSALVNLFVQVGLADKQTLDELASAAKHVQTATQDWRADVPVSQNKAKQLALELVGKSPVIYAGPSFCPVAYKWKINFNENAKNVAWCNQLPEFNHNEFLGWSSHPVEKPYGVVYLQSSFDHPQITKRFEVSKKLLSGKMPNPEVVQAEGQTLLEQLLWTITLGDFVSLYVALLNNLDPTPVELIEKLKKELA